eukprot:4833773-Alexandrium_andersonii.AAC.1
MSAAAKPSLVRCAAAARKLKESSEGCLRPAIAWALRRYHGGEGAQASGEWGLRLEPKWLVVRRSTPVSFGRVESWNFRQL